MARIALLGCVVEGGIPERHDRVAHVFVDCSVAGDDGVGHRGEKPVHQRGEPMRVVLVAFGNCGETLHVAEHDRHDAVFPAEHELL